MTADNKVGVDIEQIKSIDFCDFQSAMTVDQWNDILGSCEPLRTFYTYWTKKECVMKADGRGMFIPLDTIKFNGSVATCGQGNWHLRELEIDSNYSAHLAVDTEAYCCRILYREFGTLKRS
jgi:4'-phosphopantetheinyl transferase